MKAEDILSLPELEGLAQATMSAMTYGYVTGAAADELTLRANVEDWQKLRLKPTVLVDVSELDLSVEIIGQKFTMPILLAPTAFHRLCHKEAELATVAGANLAQAGMVMSSFGNEPIEKLAAMATQPLWFQLYMVSREIVAEMVERAQSGGCKAFCVTVDTPVLGARHREIRTGFKLPEDCTLPNLNLGAITHRPTRGAIYSDLLNPKLTWKDIEWLCSFSKVPVLLKGVLNPDDAIRAANSGVAGIIVSNHGARNLDTLPSTAQALPRIAQKLQGRIPLLVDGGIRRGTDVLKALALGANAVLVGRPYLYALSIAGAAGVARVLEILKVELQMAMALTGKTKISEIDRTVLWD
jgi:4-hydroxymandelate oxidase